MRAQPDFALLAEDSARERQQRALQIGQRDVLVDRQPLDLMELRGVRGIGVGAIHAAGDHHIQGRRVRLHRAHLHRRGVRSQHQLAALKVERVAALARGVGGAVVERVEVVVLRLDLGTFHHGEAEPQEDVLELAAHRREQVQAPDRLRRRAGQRHVERVRLELPLELGLRQLARTLAEQVLERPARLVRRLPDRRALLGGQPRDAAQQLRQRRLAP